MSTCQIHERHPWIKCQNATWASDPEGLCLLHSRDQNKDKDGAFSAAVKDKLAREDYDFRGVFFPGPVSFERYEFKKDADFSWATFSGGADFSGATFTERADFSWATFSSEADFSGAIFSGWTDFREAKFHDRAYFSGATFSGEAGFYESTFFKEVDFFEAIFSDKANFFEVNFLGEALFIGAIISAKAQVILRSVNPSEGKNRRLPFLADFGFLKQEPGGRLIFQDLNLAKVYFSDMDLRAVEFDQVNWASWCWRAAIYDEIILHQRRWSNITYMLKHGGFRERRKWRKLIEEEEREPSFEDFAQVERLYRHLKINYENERDFKRVGDFHYGEMEMHRRGNFWRQWMPFSWHNLYRLLSGYGERPLRAFIWLLLLIPAWAGLVWWLGINQAGPKDPTSYWNSFLFVLEKALLQRPAWPEGINGLGKILGSLSVLLLPGQAALFILALRNRLGRRR